MADREEIIDLAVRYTWALDARDVDDLRNVFTRDATAMLRGVACNGVDEIIDRIGGAVHRFDRTQHLVGSHQVDVDGDTGTHRCHLQAQHVLEHGENLTIGGYYEDRVVRTAEGWRIAHRVMQQTWAERHPNIP